jgi:predicted nuclease with RNAse H fold
MQACSHEFAVCVPLFMSTSIDTVAGNPNAFFSTDLWSCARSLHSREGTSRRVADICDEVRISALDAPVSSDASTHNVSASAHAGV